MSVSTAISSELRALASYLPPCPLCSVVGVGGFPDRFICPAHRPVTIAPSTKYPTGARLHKIEPCCGLSVCDEVFDDPALAAIWWKVRRQRDVPDVATNNRRKNMLAKLEAAGMEAIE